MSIALKKKYVESERGRTYYWTTEDNKKTTLVFLPGLTADHRLFEQQIKSFHDDFSIIVWDAPCHGQSRPYDEFTFKNVTEELFEILNRENVFKAYFVGQSLGGMIAQSFIDYYPHMALGLVAIGSSPFGQYYSKLDYFWLNQMEWICRLFPDSMLRKSMAKACGVQEYTQHKMMDMLSQYEKKELCHLMHIGLASFIPENRNVELPCPVILIVGEKDKVGKVAQNNKKWSERCKYKLVVIPGASHNTNEDCPTEVNHIIREFIEDSRNRV